MNLVRENHVLIKPAAKLDDEASNLVQLSNFDLAVVPMYVNIIYAFQAPTPLAGELKEGLAKVLIHFREWAGRYTKQEDGSPAIHLNDEGVTIVEAKVDGMLADAMPFDPSPLLLHFIPPTQTHIPQPLILQLTYFTCGGMVIGLRVHHPVADGYASTFFLNSWGKIVRGENLHPLPLRDRSLLKARSPPQPLFDHIEYSCDQPFEFLVKPNLTTKRFHFDATFVQKIKAEASHNADKPRTKFESLMAHTWRCISQARGLPGDVQTKVSIAINARKRLDPPLPQEYFGNAVYESWAQTSVSQLLNQPLEFAAGLIHKAIAKVDNNFLRSAIDYLEIRKHGILAPPSSNINTDVMATSWINFPIYELDFGWGKPVYMNHPFIEFEGYTIFLDSYTKDRSVDVMICLSEGHMAILEQLCFWH